MRIEKPAGLGSADRPSPRKIATRLSMAALAASVLATPGLTAADNKNSRADADRPTTGGGVATTAICIPDTIALPPPAQAPAGPGGQLAVELEGDQVEYQKDELVILRGHAQAKRGKSAVFADELKYFKKTDEVEATGNVSLYSEEGDLVKTDRLRLQVPTQIGDMDKAEFQVADRRRKPKDKGKANVFARGTAGKTRFEGQEVMRLRDATFTTCVKGQDDVVLSASEMVLDHSIGQGEARNATLRFFGVPVFYFPWVSFPISNERKSGFLYPSLGFREGSGFMLSVPYYFNLAPNYDATVWGRWFAERGVQAAGEFRYLTPRTEGIVGMEALPGDDKFGDDRYALSWQHDQVFDEHWTGLVDVGYVSDSLYLEDFRTNLNLTSSSYVPQLVQARYLGPWSVFMGRVAAYQTVDDLITKEREPYDRLPQLLYRSVTSKGPYGIRYGLEAEGVNFDHPVNVEGTRLDATPYLRLPLKEIWGFVEPKLSLRMSNYNLDKQEAGLDDSISRVLPVFSVRSGLFLERDLDFGGAPYTHTLEPEVFYTYTPFEKQDDIPVFDTSAVSYSNFSDLFRENRFFGPDRVGDNNQATLALTSRLLDDEGRERIRARIGQAYFFEDRKVNLSPGTIETDSTSDVLGEILARFTDNWYAYTFINYDDDDSSIRSARVDAIYRHASRSYVDLGYSYRRNSSEQLIVNSEWPLAPRWHLMLSEHYSLSDGQNLDTTVGVEYNDCCWIARVYAQNRAVSGGETRQALLFELELPGLGRFRPAF